MRAIISVLLAIVALFELLTSVVLYIVPSGRVAYWAGYTFLGLGKTQWQNLHIVFGLTLVTLVLLHTIINYRSIIRYLRNKKGKVTILNYRIGFAFLVVACLVSATIYKLPPVNSVINFGEEVTAAVDQQYGEPPYGHAEMSSLAQFCKRMNLDLATAMGLLEGAGLQNVSPEISMMELATANDRIPSQIFAMIKVAKKKVVPSAKLTAPVSVSKEPAFPIFPEVPPAGFGTNTIREIATQYQVPLSYLVLELQNRGLVITEADTVKELAKKNNTSPMMLFSLIREVVNQR